ncbi:MAG TPA: hypothetical protein VFV05_09505 [Methylomirabilota bacterium]|nr:hypothetical protein [Methylomirabilota bacterium]
MARLDAIDAAAKVAKDAPATNDNAAPAANDNATKPDPAKEQGKPKVEPPKEPDGKELQALIRAQREAAKRGRELTAKDTELKAREEAIAAREKALESSAGIRDLFTRGDYVGVLRALGAKDDDLIGDDNDAKPPAFWQLVRLQAGQPDADSPEAKRAREERDRAELQRQVDERIAAQKKADEDRAKAERERIAAEKESRYNAAANEYLQAIEDALDIGAVPNFVHFYPNGIPGDRMLAYAQEWKTANGRYPEPSELWTEIERQCAERATAAPAAKRPPPAPEPARTVTPEMLATTGAPEQPRKLDARSKHEAAMRKLDDLDRARTARR